MNKAQFSQVMGYLDSEYAGIVSRMSGAERQARLEHWKNEIGSLEFNAVMEAIRELSRGQYMPRTAEVIEKVSSRRNQSSTSARCRIFRDASGNEVLDLRHSDGSEFLYGYLNHFPEWMQLKFRWMANPNAENTLAWDSFIAEHGG